MNIFTEEEIKLLKEAVVMNEHIARLQKALAEDPITDREKTREYARIAIEMRDRMPQFESIVIKIFDHATGSDA